MRISDQEKIQLHDDELDMIDAIETLNTRTKALSHTLDYNETMNEEENFEEENFDEIYSAIANNPTLNEFQKDRLMDLVSDFLYVEKGFDSPETDK